MTAKLLYAGVALTAIAVASESEFPRRQDVHEVRGSAVVAAKPAVKAESAVSRNAGDVGFTRMILEGVRSVDRSLIQLQPLVREEKGPRGNGIRLLAAKASRLNERALLALEAGKPFEALELVVDANSHVEAARRKFERE